MLYLVMDLRKQGPMHAGSLVMGGVVAEIAGEIVEERVDVVVARIVVVGVHKAPVELDLVNLLIRELHISGSMAYPTEFPQVIAMLTSGQVDPSPLISHRFPLSEFPTALATAQDRGQAIKVLVDCQS